MSPPSRQISFTSRELIALTSGAGTRNTVSMLGRAGGDSSWSSATRTRSRPRCAVRARSRQRRPARQSHQQAVEGLHLHGGSPANTSRSKREAVAAGSSGVFCSFTRIATTTRSKIRAAREIRSTWPLVSGSNDPGHTAIRCDSLVHAHADSAVVGRAGRTTTRCRRPSVCASAASPAIDAAGTLRRACSITNRPPGATSAGHRVDRLVWRHRVRRVEQRPRRTPRRSPAGAAATRSARRTYSRPSRRSA